MKNVKVVKSVKKDEKAEQLKAEVQKLKGSIKTGINAGLQVGY